MLELNLSEISSLFFPPPFFLLPCFDVKLNSSAAHSWMWPTHKTFKTHVESLLPITSCVTLADYIYVAIFRKRWPLPAYYATKHTLIFVQLIFDVHGLRRHFPNKFVIVSSFMLQPWNIFWSYFQPKEIWESICSCVIRPSDTFRMPSTVYCSWFSSYRLVIYRLNRILSLKMNAL